MTTGESLINWLYGFGGIESEDLIETDQLSGEAGSYGLYKQPNTIETLFIDGTRDVTEYYYLLARRASKGESARASNLAWMERLENWVRAQNMARRLPELDGKRVYNSVKVSVSAYMSDAEDKGTAEYQMSLNINYTEV